MQIDRPEASYRTIMMMADFVHTKPSQVKLADDVRKDLGLGNPDLQVLQKWIMGPIRPGVPGYFQDVVAQVTVGDLLNPKTVTDVDSLVDLIWSGIPVANQL